MTEAQVGMPGPLILYQSRRSTSSKQVRLYLAEKRLPWESRFLDLVMLEQYRPEYLRLNPAGQVPTLVTEKMAICGSAAIIGHIESRIPSPLMAGDDTGTIREWIDYIDEIAKPAVFAPTWHRQVDRLREAVKEPAILACLGNVPSPERHGRWRSIIERGFSVRELEQSRQTMTLVLSRIEAALRRSEWLVGQRYSLADIAAVVLVERAFDLWPSCRAEFPRACEWHRRIAERAAFALAG